MFQPHNLEAIKGAIKKYQPAPGARKMMDWEMKHAKEAEQRGIYITYYCEKKDRECSRVGS